MAPGSRRSRRDAGDRPRLAAGVGDDPYRAHTPMRKTLAYKCDLSRIPDGRSLPRESRSRVSPPVPPSVPRRSSRRPLPACRASRLNVIASRRTERLGSARRAGGVRTESTELTHPMRSERSVGSVASPGGSRTRWSRGKPAMPPVFRRGSQQRGHVSEFQVSSPRGRLLPAPDARRRSHDAGQEDAELQEGGGLRRLGASQPLLGLVGPVVRFVCIVFTVFAVQPGCNPFARDSVRHPLPRYT